MDRFKKRVRDSPGRLWRVFKKSRTEEERPSTPTPTGNAPLLKRLLDTPGKIWRSLKRQRVSREQPSSRGQTSHQSPAKSITDSILSTFRVLRPTRLFQRQQQPSPEEEQFERESDDYRPTSPSPARPLSTGGSMLAARRSSRVSLDADKQEEVYRESDDASLPPLSRTGSLYARQSSGVSSEADKQEEVYRVSDDDQPVSLRSSNVIASNSDEEQEVKKDSDDEPSLPPLSRTGSNRRSRRVIYSDEDEEQEVKKVITSNSDEEQEVKKDSDDEPSLPPLSRTGSNRRSRRVIYSDEDEDEEVRNESDDDRPVRLSPAQSLSARSSKVSSDTEKKEVLIEGDSDDAPLPPLSRTGSKKRSRRVIYSDSDEDEEVKKELDDDRSASLQSSEVEASFFDEFNDMFLDSRSDDMSFNNAEGEDDAEWEDEPSTTPQISPSQETMDAKERIRRAQYDRDAQRRSLRLNFSRRQDLRLNGPPEPPEGGDEYFWSADPEYHPGALTYFKTSLKSVLWMSAPLLYDGQTLKEHINTITILHTTDAFHFSNFINYYFLHLLENGVALPEITKPLVRQIFHLVGYGNPGRNVGNHNDHVTEFFNNNFRQRLTPHIRQMPEVSGVLGETRAHQVIQAIQNLELHVRKQFGTYTVGRLLFTLLESYPHVSESVRKYAAKYITSKGVGLEVDDVSGVVFRAASNSVACLQADSSRIC